MSRPTNQSNQVKHRNTKQRQRIQELLQKTNTHPTADWIYNQIRKDFPRLSLGTVYRNLRILKQLGKVNELVYGSTYSRFDGKTEDHCHFICEECEWIEDIDLPDKDKLIGFAKKQTGFKIKRHRLEFFGLCERCRKKSAKKS